MAIEAYPLENFGPDDLKHISHELHTLVSKPEVSRMLMARYLIGVVRRHTVSPEATNVSLAAAQVDIESGVLAAHILMEEDGSVLGMETAQPRLTLRQQRVGLLPPRVSRRIPGMSQVLERESAGTNVAVWADPSLPESGRQVMAAGYQRLRGDGDVWTVEPVHTTLGPSWAADIHSAAHAALLDAGYTESSHLDGHYDDRESGIDPVPLSRLYIA